MKTIKDYINEQNNEPNYKKYTYGGETWYESKYKGHLIAIITEIDNNKWWNLRIDSKYLVDDNYEFMSFETPEDAMDELNQQIESGNKITVKDVIKDKIIEIEF